ncbi:acetate uptake transporter [Streptomyces sp. 21So2-11]|uniref:acetate uptake transporter n=1 Tax=Streptomyces sp. 21So2-11 TaxID=3144408 RepID=UPI0032199EFC
MDTNDVSAGSTTTVLGHLALGLTLLAFGIGHTEIIDGVTAADAVPFGLFVGGIALFVAGLFEFRAGSAFTGTAFAGLAAFWFTWGVGADAGGAAVSAEAAGLFLLLFALLALSLTLGAAGSGMLTQGMYGMLCVSLLLLGIAQFADSAGLAKAAGWVAVVAGAASWYAATAALAHWPKALPGHAPGHRMTAAG